MPIEEEHPDGAGARSRRFFGFLLLLSGFCGISYEILYARMLGNLVGDQFAVFAAVLLTFLLGIGFGTLWAHRLWRWLWLIEASIGGYGVFFALGRDLLDSWLYAALPIVGRGLGPAMLVCFLLLCLPSFLIGCSLPLFAGYLGRLRSGRAFARAYMVYNFGAALTALVIEFVLMRLFGLQLAVLSIAALNGFVALALLLGYGRIRRLEPQRAVFEKFPRRHLVALGLASIASAAFQLLMIKLAEFVIGPFHETFALVLALILLGIAVGTVITTRLGLSFNQVILAALIGLLFLLAGLPWVAALCAKFYWLAVWQYPVGVVYKLAILGLLMLLPALGFGATIPALITVQRNVARESGLLLFVASVANAAGFLLMAFVLHRHLEYGTIALTIFALSAVALVVHIGKFDRRVLGVAVLSIAAIAAHRVAWDESLLYLGHRAFHSPKQLALAREVVERSDKFKGYQDVFSINWSKGQPWLFINGYQSITLTNPSEKLVGAFSSVFAPRTDRALVLGLGSGATAGAVSTIFDRTDAVEINPVLVKNLFRMADYNFDLENNPGTRIIVDDAIHFVKTTDETYSMVINTVTTPLYFSSSKLYTRDFLETISPRLAPGGIYVTWMDSRIGDLGAEIVIKTVTDVFRSCWLGAVKDAYYLLICSQDEVRVHQPDVAVRIDELNAYFAEQMLAPEWIPYGLLTTDASELVAGSGAPLNTLDFPALEFEMARAAYRGIPKFMAGLNEHTRLDRVEQALAPAMDFDPVHLLLYAENLIGPQQQLYQHWKRQVLERVPDFETRRRDLRLETLAALAERFNTAELRHRYGYALLENERYEPAIVQFELALELDPGRQETPFCLGLSYEKLGRFDRALDNYKRELSVDPRDAEATYRRGVVFAQLGGYDRALVEFDSALALVDRAEIHFARGQILERLRRPDMAMQAYRRALRQDPGQLAAQRALDRLASLPR